MEPSSPGVQSSLVKAGVTTHITVFKRTVLVDGTKKTETTVYASLVEGSEKQDSNMVMCILESVFQHYKLANPDIEDLYVKSDNAGQSHDSRRMSQNLLDFCI